MSRQHTKIHRVGREIAFSLFADANIYTFHYFAKHNTVFFILFFYADIYFYQNYIYTLIYKYFIQPHSPHIFSRYSVQKITLEIKKRAKKRGIRENITNFKVRIA